MQKPTIFRLSDHKMHDTGTIYAALDCVLMQSHASKHDVLDYPIVNVPCGVRSMYGESESIHLINYLYENNDIAAFLFDRVCIDVLMTKKLFVMSRAFAKAPAFCYEYFPGGYNITQIG